MNSAELAENVSPLEQICPNGGFVFAQCTLQHQTIVAAGCCGSAPDLPAGGAVIYLRPSTLDLLSPSSCISAFQHLRDRGNGLLRYHAYSVERAAVSNRSSEGGAALIGCNQQYAWQLRLRPARAREVFQKLSLAVSRLEHTINTTARPRQLVASPLPVYDGGIGPPIFNASSEALYAQNFPAASGASAAAMRLAIFNVGQVNSITEYKFAFESFGCCQLRNWYEYLDRSLTVSGSASVMGSGALLPAANATVGPMRLGPTVGSTGVVPDISFYAGGNGQRAFLVEVFLTGSTAASLFVDGSGLSGRLDVGFLWTGRIVDSIEYNEISNAWSRPQTLVNTTSMLLSRPVLYPASGGASAALTVSGSGCGGISTTLCATLTVQPVLTLSVDNQMGWRTSPQVQVRERGCVIAAERVRACACTRVCVYNLSCVFVHICIYICASMRIVAVVINAVDPRCTLRKTNYFVCSCIHAYANVMKLQATFMLDGRGGSNLPVCSGSPSGPGSTSAAWAFTGAAVSSGVAEMDMIDFDGLPINLVSV